MFLPSLQQMFISIYVCWYCGRSICFHSPVGESILQSRKITRLEVRKRLKPCSLTKRLCDPEWVMCPLVPQFSCWSNRDDNTFQSYFLGVFVMLEGGNGCEGALTSIKSLDKCQGLVCLRGGRGLLGGKAEKKSWLTLLDWLHLISSCQNYWACT